MRFLRKRGRIYYAVVTVPRDLQYAIGRKQLWRSLQTTRYNDALLFARKILNRADELFFVMRYGSMDKKVIDSMVAEFALTSLELNDKLRLGVKVLPETYNQDTEYSSKYAHMASSKAGRELLAKARIILSEYCKEKKLKDEMDSIPYLSGIVDRYLCSYNQEVDRESDDYKEVLAAFATVEKMLEKIEAEKVVGDDDTEYQDRIISKWKMNLLPKTDKGIPFSQLLNEYYSYGEKYEWDVVRAKRKQGPFHVFSEAVIDVFGRDIGIKEIDEEKARDLLSYLSQLPAYTRQGEIGEGRLRDNDPVAASTVNKWLEDLSAAFNWGMGGQRKLVDHNPFKKLRLPEQDRKRDRSREFTPEELQLYINLLAETYDPASPEKTWIPLCILYGGPRNNEIAQLHVDDINQENGIWYFNIKGDTEKGQRTKAEPSDRSLPIHSTLIDLGILEHWKLMKGRGERQLWPNLALSVRTGRYYSDNLSNELNRLIDDNITEDKKLRVYSLRSNFENAVEHKITGAILDAMDGRESFLNGMESLMPFFERALKDVMGHAQRGATTDRVYRKARLTIMKRMVEQAEYYIDLSKLKEKLTGN